MRARWDGGTPGPVSRTSTATAPFDWAELELDAAAVRRPPKGVRQEVRDHLEHTIAVGDDDRRIVGARQPVVDLATARLLGEGAVCLIEHALEIDLLVTHREAVGLELREIEDVADEALEPVRLGNDDLE